MASEVEIDLNGEKFMLRATIRATLALGAETAGGLAGTSNAVSSAAPMAMVRVILAGLTIEDDAKKKEMQDKVLSANMGSLIQPLNRYLNILLSGGRERSKDDAEKDAGNASR